MHGDPALWQALIERLTDLSPGLPALPARRRGQRRAGLRQLGRHPGTPPLRGAGAPGHPAALRRAGGQPPGGPHHPVRGGDRGAPAPDGHGREHGGRHRLAGAAGRRPAAGRARRWPCRATSTPALCLAGWEVAAAETRDVLARAGTAPGHIFNLGHGVLPETDPAVLEQVAHVVHTEGGRRGRCDDVSAPASPAHRGAGDGPRHPRPPRGHRALLHADPSGPAAHPRAPGRADRPVRGPGRGLPPGRAHPGPGGRAGRRPRLASPPAGTGCAYGAKHTAPTIEEAVASLVAAGVGTVIGIVLTPHQSVARLRGVPAPGGRPPSDDAAVRFVPVPSWHRAPGLAALLAGRTVDRARRPGRRRRRRARPCSSPPTASPSGWWPRGTPTPTRWRESASDIAGLAGLDDRPGVAWGVAWQSAGPDRRPVDRPRPARRDPPGWPPPGCRRGGGLPGRIRLRPPRGPLRPRHRGRRRWPDSVGRGLRPDPVAQRRPARSWPFWPAWWPAAAAAVSRSRRPVVAVVGGGIAGLAAAWELVAGPAGDDHPEVHVVEADRRVGGKVRSAEFGGRTVDLAADAFLARRPEAVELCEELGITDGWCRSGRPGAVDPGPGPAPPHAGRAGPRGAHPLAGPGPVGHPEPGGAAPGGPDLVCPTSAPARGHRRPVGRRPGRRAPGAAGGGAAGRPADRGDPRRRRWTSSVPPPSSRC